MAIFLHCPCGRKLQVKGDCAGQEGHCPACGRILSIPTEGDAPAASARLDAVARAADLPPHPAPRHRGGAEEVETFDFHNVPNHGNGPIPDDADFFARPPLAIGPLRSAMTSLREGKRPLNIALRLLLSLGAGIGALLLTAILLVTRLPHNIWVMAIVVLVGGGAAGLAAAIGAWGATRFRHTCTFVGPDGVARFVFTRSRECLTAQEVFLFREATELRATQTHQYVNGIYSITLYAFTWHDIGGRIRFTIKGSHRKLNKPLPSTHSFQFGRAAELAWTAYLIGDVNRQLQLSGSVRFNLTGGQWVRLGKGSLTLGLSDPPVQLDAADVALVQVDKGVVRIRRVDAEKGWVSSRGIYKFNYVGLANAQLFFHLLNELVGVRVARG